MTTRAPAQLYAALRFTATSTVVMSVVLICMLLLFYGSSWEPSRYYR